MTDLTDTELEARFATDEPPPHEHTRPPRPTGTSSNGTKPKHPLPHDLDAEAQLLGIAMVWPDRTADTVTQLDATDYYKPAHGHIHAAITAVLDTGNRPDPALVALELDNKGLLEAAGGRHELIRLQVAAPTPETAVPLAEAITHHARARRAILRYTNAAELAAAGQLTAAWDAVEDLYELDDKEDDSWGLVDFTKILDGTLVQPEPVILTRDDGKALFYLGKIHALNAESESAKTWITLYASAQVIAQGHHVLFIDFEDDAPSIAGRLLALGVTPEQILEQFHYIRPDDPIDTHARLSALHVVDTYDVALAVIDGVTEAMVSSGQSITDNDDVARFYAALARPLAYAGPAVVLIDHVVKDKETRGRYAIGGQHKLAGITGASYLVEAIDPFAPGRTGRSRITVTKDKGGQVRRFAIAARNVGEFRMASNAAGDDVTAVLAAPSLEGPNQFRPTGLMEAVSIQLERCAEQGQEPTKNTLLGIVNGNKKAKAEAIDVLVDEKHIGFKPGPNNSQRYFHITPYRQVDDPKSDKYEPLPDEPQLGDF